MKKFYAKPKAEVIELNGADIIATSGDWGDLNPGGSGEGFDNLGE